MPIGYFNRTPFPRIRNEPLNSTRFFPWIQHKFQPTNQISDEKISPSFEQSVSRIKIPQSRSVLIKRRQKRFADRFSNQVMNRDGNTTPCVCSQFKYTDSPLSYQPYRFDRTGFHCFQRQTSSAFYVICYAPRLAESVQLFSFHFKNKYPNSSLIND